MRTHAVGDAEFDDFAAGHGTPSGVAALRSAQVSRRLLLLRSMLGRVDSDHLAPARRLLDDVRERDSHASLTAMAAPHFGAWTVAAYRASRATGGAAPNEALDDLGKIAAAAAIRAGMSFTIDVPAIEGHVVLPGLGRATTGDGMVTIAGAPGRYRVGDTAIPRDPTVDTATWAGSRYLRSTADGCTLAVCLDDLDRYRDQHRLNASGRLSVADVGRWRRMLDGAWGVLVRHHRRYAEAIAAGLVTIVPLAAPEDGNTINATSLHAFGSVALSPPSDELALASSLLHEFQHAKLGGLLDVHRLYIDDGARRHYAPWRDDPRPLGGLLQGAYAFLGVTDFWRAQRHLQVGVKGRFAQFEFARWRDQVWRTLPILERSSRFTADGERFLYGMRSTLRGWLAEPVPDDILGLAADATEDHWTRWRLRNLRPDSDQSRLLAEAWLRGSPEPPLTVATRIVAGDVRARARSGRLDLAMLRVTDPDLFSGTCAQPSGAGGTAPVTAGGTVPVTAGDLAYAAGDFADAVHQYRTQVDADPYDRNGWAGLVMAARRLGGPDAPQWRVEPELTAAVYRAIREAGGHTADPVDLTKWLAGADALLGQVGGGSTTQ